MLALALALLSLAPVEPARKLSTTLAQQVDASSFICIGTVDEVISVPRPKGAETSPFADMPEPLEFARIRVERVLKGDPATKTLYHEAWGTWMCDTTRANPGERSLFLLEQGVVSKMTEAQRGAIECALSSKLIFRNVYSGDGIIPIHQSGDREIVDCVACTVDMVIPGEHYAAQWKAVLSYVETLARFSSESVALLAQRRGFFDLRVLPNGERRLALFAERDREVVTVDQFDPVKWKRLLLALDATLENKDWAVGPAELWATRRLRIRSEQNTLDYVQPPGFATGAVISSEKPALVQALKAWAIVRDALDCASCIDDREADLEVLQDIAKKQ